jgi:hypothetical protein
MVESILEEEALARKGESGIHLEVVYVFNESCCDSRFRSR